jgi:hypothetical protein
VYVYLDPRKPGKYKYGEYEFDYEPFYVGKGENNRINIHLNGYILENDPNKMKTNIIKKIIRETSNEPIRIFYKENMVEQDAFDLETLMIITIGRKDLGLGPLTNMTNGGEGLSGRIVSEKEKEIKRLQMSGKNNPMYGIHMKGKNSPNFGRKWSDEILEKMSKSKIGKTSGRKGKHNSEENNMKLSLLMTGKCGLLSHNNKYVYILSNEKDYWTFFSPVEKHYIFQKFKKNQTNIIIYKNIEIIRRIK